MSQAPVEASEYRGAAKAYVEATMELNRQVDAGTSWSGNERNNLFLNLGKEGAVPDFADASALMGFDFPDDSRGLVSLDWDFDGDLDFITTNRPQSPTQNQEVDHSDYYPAPVETPAHSAQCSNRFLAPHILRSNQPGKYKILHASSKEENKPI